VGIPLKQLKLKKNILLSAIVRGNKTILPGGDTEILPGDHAVVVTKAGWLKVLDDILD
jgi:trk system potassium uptake protein TrkA